MVRHAVRGVSSYPQRAGLPDCAAVTASDTDTCSNMTSASRATDR